MRHLSYLDTIIQEVDAVIQSLIAPQNRVVKRAIPGKELQDPPLSTVQKREIAALMRVNHSGEICAQALYQGQAFTAHLPAVRQQMRDAADEEIDHLGWCEQRLSELNAKPALLNPLWYLGSFMLGAFAGFLGDKISLGFLAETEQQVSVHLQKHLEKIPLEDKKTKAILETMQTDEAKHAQMAREAGAIPLPEIIQNLMRGVSKIMTTTSYHF